MRHMRGRIASSRNHNKNHEIIPDPIPRPPCDQNNMILDTLKATDKRNAVYSIPKTTRNATATATSSLETRASHTCKHKHATYKTTRDATATT